MPKGFEKFFKPKNSKEGEQSNQNQDTQPKRPNPPTPKSSGSPTKSNYDQWSFKLFGGTGKRYSTHSLYFRAGMSNSRPAGQMWPAT